jgi:hypothetical protein
MVLVCSITSIEYATVARVTPAEKRAEVLDELLRIASN